MSESNTVVSAYTLYRDLQQYCSHPSKWENLNFSLMRYLVYIYKLLTLSQTTSFTHFQTERGCRPQFQH